ncbi:Mitochondrial uncoupling protein 2 [Lamellibrachia satsuma]|nr:Mitochondrial uncoupling protein 2 [Lamellibrachia satsuma]
MSRQVKVAGSRTTPVMSGPPSGQPSLAIKFTSAGLAACSAEIATVPFDTAKVRLQLQGEQRGATTTELGAKPDPRDTAQLRRGVNAMKYRGLTGTIATMCREEGPRSLYNGLAPGLHRQLVFASIRIGLYDDVKRIYADAFKDQSVNPDDSVPVGVRVAAGVTTGAFAITCAQPTDVVKVRMQAQRGGALVRYASPTHAYRAIATNEGVRGLWKGLLPNIARNSIVNAAELVTYDMVKETILRQKLLSDNMTCHFVSAFGAGFCATVVASPVDVVKTRFMNSGSGIYRGATHCAMCMLRENGLTAFYKGFMPAFIRLASWNVVMFMCFEQFKRAMMARDASPLELLHVAPTKSPVGLQKLVQQVNYNRDLTK